MAATGVLLLIPLTAMQFTSEVYWTGADFLVMGGLLLSLGGMLILLARKAPTKYYRVLAVTVLLAFLYLWVELSVGLFFSLGS
ncbi:hypothetical protein DRW07_10485 [Alteromonas sediminis]|uniref:Uncharacterized protein n=2 Tax=Alteromonas sediminis TaxID=2259342 RepID=A0A3N5Y7L1_9ALTE|nr:hypothetical protein DRW07_10485 [Alteromonas sediminis]